MIPMRRIVYLGIGYTLLGSQDHPIEENEWHTAIDENNLSVVEKRARWLIRNEPSKKVEYIQADAKNTHLPSGIADEEHVHNLLSEYNLTDADREIILREALRIAKPGRPVFVSNSLTPEQIPQAKLNKMVKKLGGRIEYLIRINPGQREFSLEQIQLMKLLMRGCKSIPRNAAALTHPDDFYLAVLSKG